MPSRLTTPVVTVDTAKIHKVDTANAQSLHGMWMVFSKCADYMEEGRRLENLSWRLWTRETFCVEPATSSDASVLPLLRQETPDMPELSASVESAASDQAERIEHHIKRPKCEIKPTVVREDSMASLGRGKEKHITSLGLERMVMSIKEKKNLEPISTVMATVSPPVVDITPRPSTPTPTPPSESTVKRAPSPPPSYPAIQQPNHSTESCSTTAPDCNDSDAANANASDTSVSSSEILPSRPGLIKSPSIVRGFSPSIISSSYRSQPRMTAEPSPAKSSTQLKPTPFKKKGGMFTLGGSSGDDDESSFEERMVLRGPHRSSLSDELSRSATGESIPKKKVTSFKEQDDTIKPVKERPVNDEDAIETEDDEVDESAIEDEDSDWEDSITESGRSSPEEREMFQRVDSKPNLVSRRSMLTMMMHQPTKMGAPTRSTPALQRSRMTSPNGPSSPPDDEDNLTMRGPGVPRSKPIVMKATPQSVAHSPRTTRRNMLATELTESLRRHLLWERQQKSATANAFLKRRHTAHDMANLQEYPNPKGAQNAQGVGMANPGAANQNKEKDMAKTASFNQYTDFGPWEYHAKGW
ncbi:hypothetical protein ETB97_002645 [Aspergillus alliaceus]|uniref:Uncharacterized protein n=1 Tax=Petromyces alliaceus TaxID=209559 RepID=A0A5N6G1R5_PETAA|nr:uncharacterized protein BDW43DRAFT_40301 [Aspergillus alliaceus]KAB8235130.1 hypothetical protein BDW43DRAFT_40301 [Aspergillus alliaceus]KAE8392801.1 hypothetical protein BDV23DRAFT_50955 [Aspergillus alliaceus]KAF5865673.1 hypothetical protein ETB97_002645 [Aspergillus burnettii]